jgi:hypothetical protein
MATKRSSRKTRGAAAGATSDVTAAGRVADVPCSLCECRFANPRELGTHILSSHCGGSDGGKKEEDEDEIMDEEKETPLEKRPKIIERRNLAPQPLMLQLPLVHPPPFLPSTSATVVLPPPPPTWMTVYTNEYTPVPAAVKAILTPIMNQGSNFAASSVSAAAAGGRGGGGGGGGGENGVPLRKPTDEERQQKFMTEKLSDFASKYICLVCNKTYTSRYNIRMHCNMHTGKNVHRCKFCGRQFAHKHVFEV